MYHFNLCRAILVGFRNQMKRDGFYRGGFVGMLKGGQEQEDLPKYVPMSLLTVKEVEELPVHQITDAKGYVLNVRIEHHPVYRDD